MVRSTLLPLLMLAIGIAILVRTVVLGGGPIATGVLVGLLFCAAGAGRMWVERRHRG
jgi:hypothetical protein